MDATTLQSPSKFPKFLFFHLHSLPLLPFVTLSSQDKETGYLGTDVLAFLQVVSLGFLGKRLTVTPVMGNPPRYVTRHLLAMPIIDFEGSCLGVIQAINKHHGGRVGKTAGTAEKEGKFEATASGVQVMALNLRMRSC